MSDKTEKSWVWRTEDDQEFYLDRDATIRFRIEDEHFEDCSPGMKGVVSDSVTPYSLTGSAQASGFGDVSWWAS